MLVNNKYKIIEKIGSGSFGSIYKGENIRTGEFVAVKVERIKDGKYCLLKNETNVYQNLKDLKCVPKIKWFGKDTNNYYMVINLLGYSIQQILEKKGVFSLVLTLKIGIKMVEIVKEIHKKGFVHRDIKPDNFLFGKDKQLYLIDFGFAKVYSTSETPCKTSSLIGSNNYASISSHKCIELSRRDDLESVCYILIYLNNGSLPWNHLREQNDIILAKERVDSDLIILKVLKYVRHLEFNEIPNYYFIIHTFEEYLKTLLEV